jgi:hypothetical protein
MWLSLVERFAWDEEVPGSNPGIPTIYISNNSENCGLGAWHKNYKK